MKILYVLEYYYPHVGGVEILFQKLAEGAIKRGHQVRVVTIKLPDTLSREFYNGVEIIRLWMPSIGMRYWFTFLAFFRLIWDIHSFDIIHTTTYNAALPVWLASMIFRKKIIISVHEVWNNLWHTLSGMNYITATLHRWFECFILKLPFDLYITISEYTKNALKKLKKSSNKIIKIYPGIDYDFFNPKKYDARGIRKKLGLQKNFIYTYFGRPGWAKGLDYLIKAVPQIKSEILNSKLLLILSPDPPSRYNAIKELTKKLSLENSVIIIDSVSRSELPKYIIASDCVVIPSLSEGFGFSAAESSALEVPIVATKAGSLPEVVSGKVCFCKAKDSHSLAEAVIKNYHKNYHIIPKKSFSWLNMINEYIDIYKQLQQR